MQNPATTCWQLSSADTYYNQNYSSPAASLLTFIHWTGLLSGPILCWVKWLLIISGLVSAWYFSVKSWSMLFETSSSLISPYAYLPLSLGGTVMHSVLLIRFTQGPAFSFLFQQDHSILLMVCFGQHLGRHLFNSRICFRGSAETFTPNRRGYVWIMASAGCKLERVVFFFFQMCLFQSFDTHSFFIAQPWYVCRKFTSLRWAFSLRNQTERVGRGIRPAYKQHPWAGWQSARWQWAKWIMLGKERISGDKFALSSLPLTGISENP